MKKSLLLMLVLALLGNIYSQELPKDVAKVFAKAEKYQKKKQWDNAVDGYKEVLRSVPSHYKSMENIGDIEMKLRPKPNYRPAYEYYQKAIDVLDAGISQSDKKKVKKYLAEEKKRIEPKRNKAKSHVKDFDRAKQNHEKGNRLMDDE